MRPKPSPLLARNLPSPAAPAGYTLIETMVVLSIVGTLALSAVGSFRSIGSRIALDTATDNLVSTLALARVAAVHKQQRVSVCPGDTVNGCTGSSQWQLGWITFIDVDRNRRLGAGESVLAAVGSMLGQLTINFRTPNTLSFNPDGSAWPNGHFKLCSPAVARRRAVIVHLTGRARVSDRSPQGYAIDCS